MRSLIRVVAIFLLVTIQLGCISQTQLIQATPTDDASLPSSIPPTTTPLPSSVSPTAAAFPTPFPLTREAMAACPVSLPNGKSPPYEADFNLGNETETIFTIPWPGGKLIFTPHGPGFKYADGSLEMKWPWYRTVPGDLIISGERLDAKAPPMPRITLRGPGDGYGETGFHPSGLLFPGEGCWRVTAQVGTESLMFVTLVVKIPVDMVWPGWLPEGLFHNDTDLTNLPESIGLLFASADKNEGQVAIEIIQGVREGSNDYPKDIQQPVAVNGQAGVCVKGEWDKDQQWRADLNAGSLEWNAGELSYRVSHTGLELGCQDLLRIAESLILS